MKITMTAISKRQHARLYTYKNPKHLRNVFIYKNPVPLQKERQFPLHFLYTNSPTLYVTQFFMKFLKLAFILKNMTHCVKWNFYIQNPNTSQKLRQLALRFYIQKAGHLALRNFLLSFWNWRRGGHFFTQKTIFLRNVFIYTKIKKINPVYVRVF